MSNILIEANNISKVYDPDILLKRGKNIYALNNVNFQLEKGDFTCIMGPSGSGKSTLLNCLSTLDTISHGTLKLYGKISANMNRKEISDFRFEKIGFVFQNHNLIPYLSIYDNIASPIILDGKKDINKKVMELATMLEIEKLLDKFPHECSGGECQRAAIARALINDPEILFCDEPTGNLDSKNSHRVLSILSKLNQQGTTILLVTHDATIASYSKTMIYLYDGNIKTIIRKNNASQKVFLDKIEEVIHQDTLAYQFDTTTHTKQPIQEQVMDVQDKKKEFVSRQTVYFVIDGYKVDKDILKNSTPLNIKGTTVTYKNVRGDDLGFDLKDIKEIHIGLSSHFVSFGLFSQFVFDVILDCVSDEGIYKFKLKNKDDFIQVINYFHQLQIPLVDPRNVEETYHKYPDDYSRTKYYQRTHKDLTSYDKNKK